MQKISLNGITIATTANDKTQKHIATELQAAASNTKNLMNVYEKIVINPQEEKVKVKAQELASKFNDQKSIKYYYGVCWKYPFAIIDRLAGTALELGKNPGAYFCSLVKKELDHA